MYSLTRRLADASCGYFVYQIWREKKSIKTMWKKFSNSCEMPAIRAPADWGACIGMESVQMCNAFVQSACHRYRSSHTPAPSIVASHRLLYSL